MASAVLSIGSNLGDRCKYIQEMEKELGTLLEAPLLKSDLMETEPVGVENQQWFLNRILFADFNGSAFELLKNTQEVEKKLGRDKKEQKASRTADIDILLFGDEIITTSVLIVPHPQILLRRFCLEGMNQIIQERVIPGTKKTIAQHYLMMSPQIRSQKIRFLDKKGSNCSDDRK